MEAFLADERSAAAKVAGVQPPRDAASANALLATGLRDSAAELQSVLPAVRKAASTKDAILAVEHGVKPKGGQEIDRALGQLKKLGYSKGS
jgi:hypothetical protein